MDKEESSTNENDNEDVIRVTHFRVSILILRY